MPQDTINIKVTKDQFSQLDPNAKWPTGTDSINIGVPKGLVNESGELSERPEDQQLFIRTVNQELSGKGRDTSKDKDKSKKGWLQERLSKEFWQSPVAKQDPKEALADFLEHSALIGSAMAVPYGLGELGTSMAARAVTPGLANIGKTMLMSGIGGLMGKGGAKLAGGDASTERLAEDIGGWAGGLSMMSPKVRAGAGGIIPGAFRELTSPTYLGLSRFRLGGIPEEAMSIIGGAEFGHRYYGDPTTGALVGATIPPVAGGIRGFRGASKGIPWISPQTRTPFQMSPISSMFGYPTEPITPRLPGGGIAPEQIQPKLNPPTQFNMPPVPEPQFAGPTVESRPGLPSPSQYQMPPAGTGQQYRPVVPPNIPIQPDIYKQGPVPEQISETRPVEIPKTAPVNPPAETKPVESKPYRPVARSAPPQDLRVDENQVWDRFKNSTIVNVSNVQEKLGVSEDKAGKLLDELVKSGRMEKRQTGYYPVKGGTKSEVREVGEVGESKTQTEIPESRQSETKEELPKSPSAKGEDSKPQSKLLERMNTLIEKIDSLPKGKKWGMNKKKE
jgi:hypothetical protein